MATDAKLWVLNDVVVDLQPISSGLVSVPVVAFLTNQGTSEETLSARTPGNIHSWEIRDAYDNVVQAGEQKPGPDEKDAIAETRLHSGQTIRGDNSLPLNGKLLKDGQRYTVHYKFWGFEAQDCFVAHIVV